MDSNKLIPYSLYLPGHLHKKLKELAKNRKASELIRNAIQMLLDGHKEYDSGYNQGLKDAVDVIDANEYASIISVHSKTIKDTLISDVKTLEKIRWQIKNN